MENFVLGVLSGGFVIGVVLLIVLISKIIFTVSEILTMSKTIFVELNKTQQMVNATMQASENFVDALNTATKEYENQPPMMFQVFKSEDGRHTAMSFKELIEKMKNDPQYQKMSDKDMDELRKLFEDNSEDEDDETDFNQKNSF